MCVCERAPARVCARACSMCFGVFARIHQPVRCCHIPGDDRNGYDILETTIDTAHLM